MTPETISALIGLVGIVLGVIPTYLFMRQKGVAEVEKLKAETDKTKAEAERIRSELQAQKNHALNLGNKPKSDTQGPPQLLLSSSPIGIIRVLSGPRQGLRVFLTENICEIIAGRSSDPVSDIFVDVETDDMTMGRQHFKISIIPVENDVNDRRAYRLQLTDLMSVNGTFLNGKMVRGTMDLQDGDLIWAGGSKFKLQLYSDEVI